MRRFFDNRGIVSWDFSPAFDAAHRAALEHGKPLVYVCAPAAWPVTYLIEQLPTGSVGHLETLILVPDTHDAADVAAALSRRPGRGIAHPLTGLGRTERLLRGGHVTALVAAPRDVHYLLRRSALKSEQLAHVAILWPETILDTGGSDDLDAVLGDTHEAQRLVVTTDASASASFIDRYARRAPVAIHSAIPDHATSIVRYAVAEPDVRVRAGRAALDILAPQSAVVWDPTRPDRWGDLAALPDVALVGDDDRPADLAIAADLPSAEVLAALRAVAGEVLVLLRATQVPYLNRIARTSTALRLPGDTDRVRTRASELRTELRRRLDSPDLTAALLAVEPLLDEYDPALLAAAAVAGKMPEQPAGPGPARADHATWTRLFVTAGRRDNVRAADILGTVLRVADLERPDVGRIDLKEQFALVEVRPDVAEHVIQCLTGEQIRGRRVTARLDRHESSGMGRSR